MVEPEKFGARNITVPVAVPLAKLSKSVTGCSNSGALADAVKFSVSPGHAQVVPLRPEFITPQDGQVKQDCEINAAKRWLPPRFKMRIAAQGVRVPAIASSRWQHLLIVIVIVLCIEKGPHDYE